MKSSWGASHIECCCVREMRWLLIYALGGVVIMKVLLFLCVGFLTTFSQAASAHLKWFTAGGPPIDLGAYYSAYIYEIAVGVACCGALFAVAVWLNRHLVVDFHPSAAMKKYIIRIFSILIGLSLLFASYSESILAVHYIVSNRVLVVLQYAQAIVGFMLIFNLFPRIAASFIIVIYLVLATQFGMLEVLDYVNFIGIALFLVLLHSDDEKQQALAVPAIRTITGLTLVVLAFSEKLLNPDLGLRFLEVNDWNFMHGLGFTAFSNELFILSAGFVELLIGLVFIFGLLTRTNTLVLVAFMVTSNVTFMIQSNHGEALTELAGHMPILAIALILLMSGSGKKWAIK